MEKQTKQTPPPLILPMIPPAFEKVIDRWYDIHGGRTSGAFGIAPLTWQDFYFYRQETGVNLSASDREAIKIIDDEFFRSRAAAEASRGRISGGE